MQGIDYTYTLQGWLKGINHPQGVHDLSGITGGPLPYGYDPGGDQAGARTNYAPDAFGMTLRYHEGDFYRIGSAFHFEESTIDLKPLPPLPAQPRPPPCHIIDGGSELPCRVNLRLRSASHHRLNPDELPISPIFVLLKLLGGTSRTLPNRK